MGEYAIRKSDGAEVKIGTCEDMYYLRYEDRNKVEKLPNSLDVRRELNLRWRLSFPDEDGVLVGEYEDYNRGARLANEAETELEIPYLDDPGTIQLTHKSGLLLNLPCYHGRQLPEVAKPMRAFWNGKAPALELFQIKNTEDGIKPIVRCVFCGNAWRFEWVDVLKHVVDIELRARLREHAGMDH